MDVRLLSDVKGLLNVIDSLKISESEDGKQQESLLSMKCTKTTCTSLTVTFGHLLWSFFVRIFN